MTWPNSWFTDTMSKTSSRDTTCNIWFRIDLPGAKRMFRIKYRFNKETCVNLLHHHFLFSIRWNKFSFLVQSFSFKINVSSIPATSSNIGFRNIKALNSWNWPASKWCNMNIIEHVWAKIVNTRDMAQEENWWRALESHSFFHWTWVRNPNRHYVA